MKIRQKFRRDPVHTFKRGDKVELMLHRIGRKIDSPAELERLLATKPAYDRERLRAQLRPFLKFTLAS